jgi:hypothetical protein
MFNAFELMLFEIFLNTALLNILIRYLELYLTLLYSVPD